jgi:hypothetical protein
MLYVIEARLLGKQGDAAGARRRLARAAELNPLGAAALRDGN